MFIYITDFKLTEPFAKNSINATNSGPACEEKCPIKDNLPKHARERYKEAYNNAWDHYKAPEDRQDDASREETAHKVAWSAVKQKYKKEEDKWVAKDE